MTALFGQLNEFQPGSECLLVYLESFELHVVAKGVPEDKKVLLLLTLIGGNLYGLLHNLMAPGSPVSKSYKEIIS